MATLPRMVEKVVNLAWHSLQAELAIMGGEAKPKAAVDVFGVEPTAGGVTVKMAPVTLRLKERGTATECVLFITVEGEITFPADADRKDLRASTYQTRVGYFRQNRTKLAHVYGVHYDHDDRLAGHPVYHSQIKSMVKFVADINTAYRLSFDPIDDDADHVRRILRNVRVPSAHMDPFSVLIQLAGDHLVSGVEDDRVASSFERLRRQLSPFRSLPGSAERLGAALHETCFRSNHWYN